LVGGTTLSDEKRQVEHAPSRRRVCVDLISMKSLTIQSWTSCGMWSGLLALLHIGAVRPDTEEA
jgi:hypothetical protein